MPNVLLPRFAFILVFLASPAFANREEAITSPYSGGTPFMLVQKDQAALTKRDVGLYLRNGSDWKVLFPGTVLMDPTKGPVFSHLPFDDRLPALAVVDGRVRLFTTQSDPANPKTFITLGDAPVSEIATGTKRDIPLIESADQLSILQETATALNTKAGQLILISLKNKAPNGVAQADGMTIAIRTKKTEGANFELMGPPLIIDHRYRRTAELQTMVYPGNAPNPDGSILGEKQLRVYSEILQQAFISRLSVQDFGDQRASVQKFIDRQEQCMQSNANFCNITQLAFWVAETGTANYQDKFTLELGKGNWVLKQNWLLAGGAPTVNVTFSSQLHQKPIYGKLRLDPTGSIWHFFQGQSSEDPLLFAAESDLYIATATGTTALTRLDSLVNGKLPQKISMVTINGTKGEVFVFLSQINGESKSTKVYVLAPANNNTDAMEIKKQLDLAKEFYLVPDLQGRASLTSTSSLVFDALTPPQESKVNYEQARNKNAPYIDILESTRSQPKYIFTNPTVRLTLSSRLRYEGYDAKEIHVDQNPSGIYATNAGKPALVCRGQLLKPDPNKESTDFLKQGTAIKTPSLPSVMTRLYALDASFRNGDHNADWVVNIDLNGNELFARLPAMGYGVKDILGHRLYAGRGDRGNKLVLASFVPGHAIWRTLTISENRTEMTVSDVKSTAFAGAPDEFVQRLVFDQHGDLHFIKTPGVSPNSREFEVLNLFTEASVFPKRDTGPTALKLDFDANMSDLFNSVNDDSKLSWKVKPFREEKDAGKAAEDGDNLVKSPMFAQLRQILSDAADKSKPMRRQIVVVPDEIKDLAHEFIRQTYLIKDQKDVPKGNLFHRFNRKLHFLDFVSSRGSQDAVFENFENAKSRKDDRTVVMANMSSLITVDRPTSLDPGKPFVLKFPAIDGATGKVSHLSVTPHVLYLMAAGAPVASEDFRRKVPDPLASTILLGTQKELTSLKAQAEAEIPLGLEKAFEVIELPLPNLDAKVAMLDEIMSRVDIKGLGFEFDAREVVENAPTDLKEKMRKLFEYAITRADTLAKSQGKNPFSSFINFLALYNESLVSDSVVRTNRKVDRSFIERILKRQFNISLNIADLPPDDPRRTLAADDAVFRLHRAGMLGEFDLKAEIIARLMAQMNHDPTRNMPSSWIWAGEPGTGKTKSWLALVKMLDLTLYRPGLDNSKANAFYLDTARVTKGDKAAIEAVINQLNHFITQPRGSSGFVFIDDLSYADEDLGKALVQWIRNLQQAERGVTRVQLAEKSVAVAVQNLSIGVAMNFSDNKELLKQYSGDDVSSLIGKIVATGAKYGIDKSFVDRFGGVYNFDRFHESVKEPSLNDALLEAARKKMSLAGQYLIVDPELVRKAAHAFPNLGARPFLSRTTDAIVTQPETIENKRSKIFALIPKTAEEIKEIETQAKPATATGAWGEESAKVQAWVEKHTRVIELNDGFEAPLMLMRLMLPSFRSPIVESVVHAMQMDPRFKADQMASNYFLGPALLAVFDHMARTETIPLRDLQIDETKFGITAKSEREDFHKLIEDLSVGTSPFIVPFPKQGGRISLWSELGVNRPGTLPTESRRDTVLRYSNKIHALIERHLLQILQIGKIEDMDNVEAWIRRLPDRVPNGFDTLGKELNDLLFLFIRDFQSQQLAEAKTGKPIPDPYVGARFFFMALDQAIVKLPWPELSRKMLNALKLATQDMVLGQSVGVQNWLFNPDDRSSLLKPTTTNLIREMVTYNDQVRATPEDRRKQKRESFEATCADVLAVPGGNK